MTSNQGPIPRVECLLRNLRFGLGTLVFCRAKPTKSHFLFPRIFRGITLRFHDFLEEWLAHV